MSRSGFCRVLDTSSLEAQQLRENLSGREFCESTPTNHLPMGTETPTNLPFCSAGPVLGTKTPSKMPTIMARRIQTARNRSRMPSALNAELKSGGGDVLACCSRSASCFGGDVAELISVPLSTSSTGVLDILYVVDQSVTNTSPKIQVAKKICNIVQDTRHT